MGMNNEFITIPAPGATLVDESTGWTGPNLLKQVGPPGGIVTGISRFGPRQVQISICAASAATDAEGSTGKRRMRKTLTAKAQRRKEERASRLGGGRRCAHCR
jgi:hypothetical protein